MLDFYGMKLKDSETGMFNVSQVNQKQKLGAMTYAPDRI